MGGSQGRPGDDEALRRQRKLANKVDNGSPTVTVWSTRNMASLRSSSRRWLGWTSSKAVSQWWALVEDVGGGEK
jgi:hypothetical protein